MRVFAEKPRAVPQTRTQDATQSGRATSVHGSASLTGSARGFSRIPFSTKLPDGIQPSTSAEVSAPSFVHDTLRSPGQALDPTTRTFMEGRLGHDLSRVRLHTGAQAAESARSIGARAFTLGSDIVFAAGQYRPHQQDGRRLLAHELAHVVQQRRMQSGPPLVQRSITLTDPGSDIPHAPGDMGPFPSKAITLESWLDILCPDGNWSVDRGTGVVDSADRGTFCAARPARGRVHHTTSAHPTACGCFCELTAPGARTIEVQIDENLTVGGSSSPLAPLGQGGTSHVSATDKVTALTGRPGPSVTGAGATTPVSGAGRAQQIESPPWIVFGHEMCGHARLQAGRMSATAVEHAPTAEGDRTAVDVENRIRREQSTVASSLGIRRGTFRARDAAGTLVSHTGAVYRVNAGETLSAIAVRCGIPVANVLNHVWRFNGDQITAATQHTLAAGEDLLVEGIDWHDVISGETMTSIAAMWAIPLASLKRANPQVAGPSYTIRPGDRLLIPVT